MEIEGAPKNCDVTRWGQFTDIKDIKKEMFTRLEIHFENWLKSVNVYSRGEAMDAWHPPQISR